MKMTPLLLIILGVSGVYGDTHTLRYCVTGVSSPGFGLPEFSSVGYVDDREITSYNRDARQYLPKMEWMKKLGADYWERNTQRGRDSEAASKHDVQTMMRRFNQTGGIHILQQMYSCELRDDGTTKGYVQVGYDGRDFMYLDTKSWLWIPTMKEAQITTQRWNSPEERTGERYKNYLENECIPWLNRCLKYGREDLEKRVRPEVKVWGRRQSGRHNDVMRLQCLVYGFHPRAVDAKWVRNGVDHLLSDEMTEILPHPDGTYQISVSIEVPVKGGDTYSCHVDHSSLEETLRVRYDPPVNGLSVAVIIGIVIKIFPVLAVCILAALWINMKEESSRILSSKMARVHLDETTPKCNSSSEKEIITPSVLGNTYRFPLSPLSCYFWPAKKFHMNTIECDFFSAYNVYDFVGPTVVSRMQESFPKESSRILSSKMARDHLDETTPKCNSSSEEEIITPSVQGNTYRLPLKPGPIFCCSETGIKFQVKSPVTIEYELEYDSIFINKIKDNGYELVGPLFNITVKPGVVSSVHLPHYLYMEDLGGEISSIKYGHIKDDGKIHFLKPTKIESSYIVLDNPSFSCFGVVFPKFSIWSSKKKSIPISGKVLLYFCVLCPHKEESKEYRTHLYLVPCKRMDLKELDEKKKKKGFIKIDKPSNTKLIVGNSYTVKVDWPNAIVIPQSQQFEMNADIDNLDCIEINVEGSATSITLELISNDGAVTGWTGGLTRADLQHHSERMLRQYLEEADSEQHFVMKHQVALIQRIKCVEPIVDHLNQENILTLEDCNIVLSENTPQMKMRALYDYVSRFGKKEKDEFYNILKKRNASIIRDLKTNG